MLQFRLLFLRSFCLIFIFAIDIFGSIIHSLAANDKNEDTGVSMHELKSLKGSYDPSTKTSGASGDRLLSDFGI